MWQGGGREGLEWCGCMGAGRDWKGLRVGIGGMIGIRRVGGVGGDRIKCWKGLPFKSKDT